MHFALGCLMSPGTAADPEFVADLLNMLVRAAGDAERHAAEAHPDEATEAAAAPEAVSRRDEFCFLSPGPPAVILIVEDHISTANVMRRLLVMDGLPAEAVYSGERALEVLRERVPRAVVLDVMLPGISGIDVLRHLRASPQTRDVPVVLFTAVADDAAIAEAARELRAEAVFNKSRFEWSELSERIRRVAAVREPPPGPP